MYYRLVHRMTLEGLVFMPDCLTKVGQFHERQEQTYSMHDEEKVVVSVVETSQEDVGPLLMLVHHGHLFQTPGVQVLQRHQ
ncbi:hypothetical protein Tco_0977571 [Tanacetum coccineum]|uniref:Uncharacterized protein n=1 Tax=Tanacetum coccineum TaxID=301880 RepID=A0ABQ5EKJ9_9ASTR